MHRITISRDNFAIAFSVLLVLITLMLIIDLQSGYNLSCDYLTVPDSNLNDAKAYERNKNLENDSKDDDAHDENNIGMSTLSTLRENMW